MLKDNPQIIITFRVRIQVWVELQLEWECKGADEGKCGLQRKGAARCFSSGEDDRGWTSASPMKFICSPVG